ncbi:hypothetical protein LOAG_03500 [Loa loa]|uniref:Uncharacterized protein n=2 Tax=Loa loa TaxID=7209 RepID=A0A1S0U497_LOALO|nr:hypothetical protein LOAG_03500 [Loa loa]EFO24985.1 hypothetical protein LOAG_03500 [Loa loa]
MSVYSHRLGSSRYRDAINLTSSTIPKRHRQFWICSQIHSRILMIIISLVVLMPSVTKSLSDEPGWMRIFIAYAVFFGAISGIWALKLVDIVHRKGGRIKKHSLISPKFIIIPSYIAQIGLIICFAIETFHYLVTNISSFAERSPLFLFFGVLIPIWLIWLMILYVFAAEINCFIYVIDHSRHWRFGQYPPPLLNTRALNNERQPFESSSRNRLTADALHERERTKSSESVVTVNSESKKAYNNMETRIEVMRPMHAADNMASCFAECSRKGISVISSQLDTVPEESSKSANSLS